jgi:hypothetical protein
MVCLPRGQVKCQLAMFDDLRQVIAGRGSRQISRGNNRGAVTESIGLLQF